MEEKFDKALTVVKQRLAAVTAAVEMQQVAQAALNLKMAKAQYASIAEPSEDLNGEIEFVLSRVRSNLTAIDMQQTTQSALHLVQAKVLDEQTPPDKTGKAITKRQGTGT